MAGKQIMLDGQVLHGHDRYGWWNVHKIVGWAESPPPKADEIERPNGHGNVPVPVRYGKRTVTVTGRLIATSERLAIEAKNVLPSLLFQPGQFAVVDGAGLQIAGVASRGRITPGAIQGRWLPFEMELNFSDPFKYGQLRSFTIASGEVAMAFHRGNVEAWPTVTVTGNMPGGYTVQFGGAGVRVTESLLPGETHRIEYRTRRLYINGQFYMGLFGDSVFRPCRAGVRTEFRLTPVSGSGTGRAQMNDTYV